MAYPLSARAEEMLAGLPPFLADSVDVQGTVDAIAREVERLDAATEEVRDNFFPERGEDLLRFWEHLLGLPVEPLDLSIAQRRQAVLAYLASIKSRGSGLDWEGALTGLIGTGWSYSEHDPADPGSPAAYTLEVLLPFSGAIAEPSGLARTTFATGGTLAAGTYYYVVTARNQYGETTISNRVNGVVTGSTSRIQLDWNAVTGATEYRVYRGTTSGAEHLLATVATNSYNDTGAASPGAAPWPTSNTTASPQAYEAEQLARIITPAHLDLIFGYGIGFIVGISQVGEEPL